MSSRFGPERFPNRIIVIDKTSRPPRERMNCLGCGQLVEQLYRSDELCRSCYEEWSHRFGKRWVKKRFPARP